MPVMLDTTPIGRPTAPETVWPLGLVGEPGYGAYPPGP